MAGLPDTSASVCVGPPLLASAPRFGLALRTTAAPSAAPPLTTRSLLLPVKVGALAPALVLLAKLPARMSLTSVALAVPPVKPEPELESLRRYRSLPLPLLLLKVSKVAVRL